MAETKFIIEVEIDEKGAVKALNKVEKEVKDVDKAANKASKSTKKLSAGFSRMAKNVALAVKGYIAFRVGAAALGLAKTAATAIDTAKAFKALADSAGISASEMLASMKKATAGTIAEFELMKQFSSASLLGLPLERFDEMLAIARGASAATGQSMEFMLNSIVTALGRGSKLMLDNLVIMIDIRTANEEYAESLNKTSRELTDVERKQAFIYKALDLCKKISNY